MPGRRQENRSSNIFVGFMQMTVTEHNAEISPSGGGWPLRPESSGHTERKNSKAFI